MTDHGRRIDCYRVNPFDIIIPGKDNARLHDETERHQIDPEMVASIIARGVLIPVLGTKTPEGWLLIDGRRRVLHAREARNQGADVWVDVKPLRFRGATQAKDELLTMIAANELRLDDSMHARALKFQRALTAGADKSEVCAAMGITRQMGSVLLDLLKLSAEDLERLGALQLSETARARLGRLDSERREEIISQLEEERASGRARHSTAEVERRTRAPRAETVAESEGPTGNDLRAALKDLVDLLGPYTWSEEDEDAISAAIDHARALLGEDS